MKRFLLLILLSVGFTNVSYAVINAKAMNDQEICGVLKSYYSGANTYYNGITYYRKDIVKVASELNKRNLKCFDGGGGTLLTNIDIPKYAVPLNDARSTVNWKCKMKYKVVDNSYCIPDLAKVSKSDPLGWECYSGYKKTGSVGKENCKKNKKINVPANAFESGNTWFCKSGFAKVGNQCLKAKVVPVNADRSNDIKTGWTCNYNYYRNYSQDKCLKVPKYGYSSSAMNIFTCKTSYKKSANKCIKKKNKLATPSYRN